MGRSRSPRSPKRHHKSKHSKRSDSRSRSERRSHERIKDYDKHHRDRKSRYMNTIAELP